MRCQVWDLGFRVRISRHILCHNASLPSCDQDLQLRGAFAVCLSLKSPFVLAWTVLYCRLFPSPPPIVQVRVTSSDGVSLGYGLYSNSSAGAWLSRRVSVSAEYLISHPLIHSGAHLLKYHLHCKLLHIYASTCPQYRDGSSYSVFYSRAPAHPEASPSYFNSSISFCLPPNLFFTLQVPRDWSS